MAMLKCINRLFLLLKLITQLDVIRRRDSATRHDFQFQKYIQLCLCVIFKKCLFRTLCNSFRYTWLQKFPPLDSFIHFGKLKNCIATPRTSRPVCVQSCKWLGYQNSNSITTLDHNKKRINARTLQLTIN